MYAWFVFNNIGWALMLLENFITFNKLNVNVKIKCKLLNLIICMHKYLY